MKPYKVEHLFSYTAGITAPEVIGPMPCGGIRANFYITGGSIAGPRLKGIVKPVGADFFTLRTDGIGVLDVRALLESQDGALIDVAYSGLIDFGADGYQKFVSGQLQTKAGIRTTPRAQTAHPAYQWLNRLQCIGIGEVDLEKLEVSYDVYSI